MNVSLNAIGPLVANSATPTYRATPVAASAETPVARAAEVATSAVSVSLGPAAGWAEAHTYAMPGRTERAWAQRVDDDISSLMAGNF